MRELKPTYTKLKPKYGIIKVDLSREVNRSNKKMLKNTHLNTCGDYQLSEERVPTMKPIEK